MMSQLSSPIPRLLTPRLLLLLDEFPAVAMVGARQVGKTTLARMLLEQRPDAVLLDLEHAPDLAKLQEPELYLQLHADKLVIIDEVQLAPHLFPVLRVLIDRRRRPGKFLLLGSASPSLLQRSSESLAGRIVFEELTPFHLEEIRRQLSWQQLWWRGGFPEAALARGDPASRRWNEAFLRAYLERDLPNLGVGARPAILSRFLSMVAHRHAQVWNGQRLASGLGVSNPTVTRYRDLLVQAFLLRELLPFHRNVGKRLVKKPKLYIRDSGLLHALLRIPSYDALYGHPIIGASFEGYVVEQVIARLPEALEASFWRTHAGAELDLVLHRGVDPLCGVEIKLSAAPKPGRGFYQALKDLGDIPGWVVHAGAESWPIRRGVWAVGLEEFVRERPFLG